MPLSRSRKSTRRQKQRRLYRSLDKRLAKDSPREGDVVQALDSRFKMSEVLLDFIDPYREDTMSQFELRNLIAAGTLAWNTAMLPPESRGKILDGAIHDAISEGAEEFREILSEMIERKRRYFARFTRFILNYQLTMTPDGPHLTVLSSR